MLDPLRGRPQRGGDPLALGREPLRPLRTVRRQPHPPALRAADEPEAHRRHVNDRSRRALEDAAHPGCAWLAGAARAHRALVHEGGTGDAQRHEERERGNDQREQRVGLAHDGALRPDDRHRGRRRGLGPGRAREVGRGVAGLGGERDGDGVAEVGRGVADLGREVRRRRALVCGTGRGYCRSAGTASAEPGPAIAAASAARTAAAKRTAVGTAAAVLIGDLSSVVGGPDEHRPAAVERRTAPVNRGKSALAARSERSRLASERSLTMDLRLLGPVEASVDDHPVAIGAGKPRALLAMLALSEGSAVSAEQLIDGLWGEAPPATAPKMVQVYVSQLRKAFAAPATARRSSRAGAATSCGSAPGDVDARRFERLVADGAPREALALWRGPPLDDVAAEPFAGLEIRRLEELRLAAIEQAFGQDLAAGRHAEVIGEIEALLRASRCASACTACGCSRSTAAAARPTRWTPTGTRERCSSMRSASSPARSSAACTRRSCARTPRSTCRPSCRRSSRRPRRSSAARRSWTRCAGPGARRSVRARRPAGDRQDAAGRRAGGRGARDGRARGLRRRRRRGGRRAEGDRAARRPILLVAEEPRVLEGPLLVLATVEAAAHADLTLGPLDAAAVAAIAREYGDDAPLERLVEASGGVPRRVHRAARGWARAEAARELDATADRAAGERAGCGRRGRPRRRRRRAAGGARARSSRPRGPGGRARSRASRRFDVDDADVFFGRERLVAELVARLVGAPLLGVVGPSGSGKSSALRAGLLPALAGGVLPGSERWAIALHAPGRAPAARARAGGRRRADGPCW